MITEDKITESFCLADDFCKYLSSELKKYQLSDGKKHRNKPERLSHQPRRRRPQNRNLSGLRIIKTTQQTLNTIKSQISLLSLVLSVCAKIYSSSMFKAFQSFDWNSTSKALSSC